MNDTTYLKPKLLHYLQLRGVHIDTSKTPPVLRCPDPSHADNNPSAVIYQTAIGNETDTVYCPVCNKTWDIFDVAAMLNNMSTKNDFPKIVEEVKNTLGEITDTPQINPQATPQAKKKVEPVPLELEEARKIYTSKKVQELSAKFNKGQGVGKLTQVWKYHDDEGRVIMIDARFENEKGKSVISIFYNGKNLQSSGYPILVYNRHLLDKNKPVVIHEGAKAAEVATQKLPQFTHIAWNGGSKKVSKIDWSFLQDYKVYLYPDDDMQKTSAGELLPPEKQPGFIAMKHIYDKLEHVKMIPPYEPAREIKSSGADIVEALEVSSLEEVAKHITESEDYVRQVTEPKQKNVIVDDESLPEQLEDADFRILGVADDGKAYFVDDAGRLQSSGLDRLSKGKLLNLTNITYWRQQFGGDDGKMRQDNWDDAFDAIIRKANGVDFDPDNIRGRGAWRETDGRICYHDGKDTIGEYSPKRLFLRKIQKDIGLKSPPASVAVCTDIKNTVDMMSFETRADAMRCLAWSVLSPFSGALPIRPAGLLTGASGTGKTAVLDRVIKPIALPFVANAQESSVAGIRQKINNDSCGIALEEAEAGTDEKNKRREEFFSLMRVSFSDDAPDAYKGTQDQSGKSFKMKNMFLFISISSEVEEVADDKRIFRINMVHKKNDWKTISANINRLLTEENCAAIRAKTWQHLTQIIETAERVAPIIEEFTGLDTRSSLSEAMLYSAHRIIWRGVETFEIEKVRKDIETIFAMQPAREYIDEAEAMVERLLEEVVPIPDTRGEKKRLSKVLAHIRSDVIENETEGMAMRQLSTYERRKFKQLAGNYGLAYIPKYDALAIKKNHHVIKKILGRGNNYDDMLTRHKDYVRPDNNDKLYSTTIDGSRCRAVLIKNVIPSLDKLDDTADNSHIPF